MNTSDSNIITRNFLDSMLVETRYINSELPSTETELFGKKFRTPIMTAALSHLHDVCMDGMTEFARGAKEAGAACFVGMGEDEDLEKMTATGADVIKIIKPHENNDVVFHKIEHAITHGVLAVGMDIDHAYSGDGNYDNVYGLPMKSKSFDEIKSFVEASSVPFVVKGVLSVHDAGLSIEAGAKAIIVSHHHGIMPYSVPPLMVLPEILKVTEGKIKVLVDCGLESGMDVFKALALGADGVCIGRDLMGALKGGSSAMAARINVLNGELKSIMARTGAHNLNDIDPGVIHYYGQNQSIY